MMHHIKMITKSQIIIIKNMINPLKRETLQRNNNKSLYRIFDRGFFLHRSLPSFKPFDAELEFHQICPD